MAAIEAVAVDEVHSSDMEERAMRKMKMDWILNSKKC